MLKSLDVAFDHKLQELLLKIWSSLFKPHREHLHRLLGLLEFHTEYFLHEVRVLDLKRKHLFLAVTLEHALVLVHRKRGGIFQDVVVLLHRRRISSKLQNGSCFNRLKHLDFVFYAYRRH